MNKSYSQKPFNGGNNRQQTIEQVEIDSYKKQVGKVLIAGMLKSKTASVFKQMISSSALNDRMQEAIIYILKNVKTARSNIYQPFYYHLKFKWNKESKQVLVHWKDDEGIPIPSISNCKEAEQYCSSLLKVLVNPAVNKWEIDNDPKFKDILDLLENEFKTPPGSPEKDTLQQLIEEAEREQKREEDPHESCQNPNSGEPLHKEGQTLEEQLDILAEANL